MPEAYDPAMLHTLVNYGNWRNEMQEAEQRRAQTRRGRR